MRRRSLLYFAVKSTTAIFSDRIFLHFDGPTGCRTFVVADSVEMLPGVDILPFNSSKPALVDQSAVSI